MTRVGTRAELRWRRVRVARTLAARYSTPMRLISSLARIAAVLLCAALVRDAQAARGPIRWVPDDWARAISEARQRDVLVVVDAWAPW